MIISSQDSRVMVCVVNYICTGLLHRTVPKDSPKAHFHSYLHTSLTGMNFGSHHYDIFTSHSRKLGQTQNQARIIPAKSSNSGAFPCLVLHQELISSTVSNVNSCKPAQLNHIDFFFSFCLAAFFLKPPGASNFQCCYHLRERVSTTRRPAVYDDDVGTQLFFFFSGCEHPVFNRLIY